MSSSAVGLKPQKRTPGTSFPLSLISISGHANNIRLSIRIFREVFHPIPDDTIKTLSDMRAFSALENPPFNTQKEMLSGIQGYLTDFPLKFFCNEKFSDTPVVYADGLVPVNVFL